MAVRTKQALTDGLQTSQVRYRVTVSDSRYRRLADGGNVRLIYVDEAGTSAKEPVTVVAAIIVDGDSQLRQVSAELASIVERCVPEELRNGFIFHAKDVFGGGKNIDRNTWKPEDRLDFYKEVLSLPFCFDVPIACSVVHRGTYLEMGLPAIQKLSSSQLDHILAFNFALERVDYYLRNRTDRSEVGSIVAEDVPEMRRALHDLGMLLKDVPIHIPAEEMGISLVNRLAGLPSQANTYEIKNIIDKPHFASKDSAVLLQLADACAFAFRRWVSHQSYGIDLLYAMLGPFQAARIVRDENWFTGTSSGFWMHTERFASIDRAQAFLELFGDRLVSPDRVELPDSSQP